MNIPIGLDLWLFLISHGAHPKLTLTSPKRALNGKNSKQITVISSALGGCLGHSQSGPPFTSPLVWFEMFRTLICVFVTVYVVNPNFKNFVKKINK